MRPIASSARASVPTLRSPRSRMSRRAQAGGSLRRGGAAPSREGRGVGAWTRRGRRSVCGLAAATAPFREARPHEQVLLEADEQLLGFFADGPPATPAVPGGVVDAVVATPDARGGFSARSVQAAAHARTKAAPGLRSEMQVLSPETVLSPPAPHRAMLAVSRAVQRVQAAVPTRGGVLPVVRRRTRRSR